MTLTFSSYGTTMAKLLAINPSTVLTTDNTDLLEQMIAYAELRIYRELDFLTTQTEVETTDLMAGTRTKAVPASIIILNSMTVITPASTAAAVGTRNPMQRVSMEFMNFFWPSTLTLGVPTAWALKDDTTIVLAPTPEAAYRLDCMGIVRPAPLSSSNTTTYITANLPDLFIAASCIWGFGGVNQNFGAMADDPQSTQSWENQYQLLKAGVNIEALRQKAWMPGWQPYSPSPEAAQSRT